MDSVNLSLLLVVEGCNSVMPKLNEIHDNMMVVPSAKKSASHSVRSASLDPFAKICSLKFLILKSNYI